MSSADLWSGAEGACVSAWCVALNLSGWGSAGLALAYGAVALLCWQAHRRTIEKGQPSRNWWAAMALLGALAVTTLWHLDVLWVQTAREWAVQQGWYAQRRTGQALVLALCLAAAGLALALHRGTSLPPSAVGAAVRLSLLLLILVALARFVSWHWMDGVLRVRVGPLSLGRALEVVGLLGLGHGAWTVSRSE